MKSMEIPRITHRKCEPNVNKGKRKTSTAREQASTILSHDHQPELVAKFKTSTGLDGPATTGCTPTCWKPCLWRN